MNPRSTTTRGAPGRERRRRGSGAGNFAARLVCLGALFAAGPAAHAQDGVRFGGRLSILPVDFATRPTLSGSGDVEAVLDGRVLKVAGTFEGLSSPAAAAHLHRAPRARRGPAVFALGVTEAASGRIAGEVELDAAQTRTLRRGGYYVQVGTRDNPDGEIRGWLLPRAEAPAAAPAPASFLAGQARNGAAAYRNVCATCHQGDLSGGLDAPALAGPAFRGAWGGRPVRELLAYVRAAMPPAGRRPDDDTLAAIVAYVLQRNGARGGTAALSAASEGAIAR